jgi:hypothetical protein
MWSQQLADVLRSTSIMKKYGLSVSPENTSQKMFNGNDTISEIVNDPDSDDGHFSAAAEEEEGFMF